MQFRELQDGEQNDIYQEYPSTPDEAFSAYRDGKYYAALYRKHVVNRDREVSSLYDSNIIVDVVLDLGMNDDMSLGFFQTWDGTERLVHDYHNTGEGLEHYINYIHDWCLANGATLGDIIVPHDIKVRELGTGISRKKRLRELGVRRIKVLKKASVNAGIEAVRRMLQFLYVDPIEAAYAIKGILNYSKEWDEIRQCWKDKPLHNEWSHPADMIRYRAMSKKEYYDVNSKNKPRKHPRRDPNVVDGLAI